MARTMPRPAGYHWYEREPIVRPDGLKPCRWCKGPVKPPRRQWCGNPLCIQEWKRRTSWAITCKVVYLRDRGVCASCGLNTDTVDSGVILGLLSTQRRRRPKATEERTALYVQLRAAQAWQREHRCQSPWEVDHVIPVSEGGDWFSMSNLQTMCVVCHRVKSKQDNARLRAKKRGSERA